MSPDPDVRWKQRFQNYSKAYSLLRNGINQEHELTQLEQEGLIQRFEFTFELAWKVLKDRMEHDGLVLDKIAPKPVIRLAHENKYLSNSEVWFKMLGDRNLMSHTYDFRKFAVVIESIREEYLTCFEELYFDFLNDV